MRNKYLEGLNLEVQSDANLQLENVEVKNLPDSSVKEEHSRPFTTALGTRKNSIRTRNQSVNFNKQILRELYS